MYLQGFGNHHASEAIPGALPTNQNSPQRCPFGLYAEQLSGSAFTMPRHVNLHSWLYRLLPSTTIQTQEYIPYSKTISHPFPSQQTPNPLRWSPFSQPKDKSDFIDGLFHIAGHTTLNAYLYQCNQSMTNRYFVNRDGELLFVPYEGEVTLCTEFGNILLKPGMIAVIPRGVFFKVELITDSTAGYLCENLGLPLTLPHLGIIGANALANPRHFLYPTAHYENHVKEVVLLCKYQQNMWSSPGEHSPLNVVAWHGNYAPYCYDLALFNSISSVSFDHPDPCIFTVLTSPSEIAGVADLDFVIFPPRWMVAENTFRPPYFHRNIMSELMGLLKGQYDAKTENFAVGGVSVHNCMTPHGPDKNAFERASSRALKPEYYNNTLAFMFESRHPWNITDQALAHKSRQKDYLNCWQSLKSAEINLPPKAKP